MNDGRRNERPVHRHKAGNLTAESSQQERSSGGQGTGPSSVQERMNARLLAQARLVDTALILHQARQRHDPQSQSLSRSYGSDLPTSLTYINLSTRGFSPWRPAADMGTSRRGVPRGPLPDFQGPWGRFGHRRNCGALRVPNPISLLEDSRELERL